MFRPVGRDALPGEPRAVEQLIDDLEALAGLPRVTPHGLRHSVGTLLHSFRVDIRVIQAIMVYTSIALTASTYVDDVDELHREAVDKLGWLLSPA
ncbi:MAG: tyrosine-type recombinase/integrase [Chloroflexota bacterium]|jgi:integrase